VWVWVWLAMCCCQVDRATAYRVCIDPGHGGTELGEHLGCPTPEKTLNLAVSLLIRDISISPGYSEYIFTRTTDRFVSLNERVAIADEKDCDLYVSVHHNGNDFDNGGPLGSGWSDGYVLHQIQPPAEGGTTIPGADQTRWVSHSRYLAQALTNSLGGFFNWRYGITTRGPCSVPDNDAVWDCAHDQSYHVLWANNRPAVLGEAVRTAHDVAQRITFTSEEGYWEAYAYVEAIRKYQAINLAAQFSLVFASADSAYALTSGETATEHLFLLGWHALGSNAAPDTLATVPPAGRR
jgi:hypothetical protein